ncbi:MAG TPA: amidohydrolase [Pyrinomonadaceae bacterium]|jgi:hippurate hydrolase|nr:amidohydrolase [Pyrinomonadaceae bacterium]
MRKLFLAALVTGALALWAINVSGQQPSLDAMIEHDMASWLTTYKNLHAAPELSHREEKTSAFVAGELRKLGFTVTERIGKFQNAQWLGYGVVAVMKNGPGPTVLVRTELDALPVEEKTGVPYASQVKTKNDAGVEVSVMHACGHDIHMTSFLGTAKLLTELKSRWSGTLVMLGQPAEETGDGANAMLRDNLYANFPRPDFAVALHDKPELETGKVGYTPGYAMASATSIDIKIRGVGGHGSAPELTKDPIVVAAQVVMALQTIVSRENSPLDPAVVTVGSIHGGTRYNIIPDEVNLQLTVRTYKEEVRKRVLASIERIAKGVAATAGIPEDRAPIVKIAEGTGSTYNDPQLIERLVVAFKQALGEENVVKMPPMMASEDFGYFSMDQKIPTTIFWLGASDPAKVAQSRASGVALPGLHSALFAPVPEPTLRTGVKAMTSAVLELMKK